MYLSEQYKIVPIIEPIDTGAGAQTGAGVNVENAHHATIIILFGDQTDETTQVSVRSGTAHDTMAANVPFTYAKRANADIKAIGADILTTDVEREASENYFLANGDLEDRLVVIEVPVAALTAGHTWIRVESSNTATKQMIAALAILQPRYAPLTTAVQTT